jgi:hypothetical protein
MDVHIEDEEIKIETESDTTIQRSQQETRRRQILRREAQIKERTKRSIELHRAAMVAETATSRRGHDFRVNAELAI